MGLLNYLVGTKTGETNKTMDAKINASVVVLNSVQLETMV